MSIAYWCVFVMICLPYLFNQIAKFGMPIEDNRRPREYLDGLEGRQKRADWAHRNTLEVLPGFIAAVLVAHLCSVEQSYLDAICVSYVVLRVAYGFFYMADKHVLRSACWMMSFGCIVAMFVMAGLT